MTYLISFTNTDFWNVNILKITEVKHITKFEQCVHTICLQFQVQYDDEMSKEI